MSYRPAGTLVTENRLQLELRAARDRAGLSQRDVALALGWSLSKIIRIENGVVGVSLTDVRALVTLYAVEPEAAERLAEYARTIRAARRRPGPETRRSLSRDFRLFLAYEEAAARMCHFNPLLVPGLLQTEAYARALLDRGFVTRPAHVDEKVAARLHRQELLEIPDPPRLEVVLDEAAIRRPIGGAGVMRAQLEHLLAVGGRDLVDLRVVPFAAGLYAGISGAFVLLEFDEPMAAPVLYLETPTTDTTIRHDRAATAPYQAAFTELQRRALDPAASAELIEAALRSTSDRTSAA